MKPIILLGGGGHCKSAIDVIESTNKFEILGVLDLPERIGETVLGYKIVGTDDHISDWIKKGAMFIVTIGQVKDSRRRSKLFQSIQMAGGEIATVISNTARVSRTAKIGRGSIVMHHSIINSDASIGENTIINSGALVEHECKIGNHCHVSTHAVLNGGVQIGDGCFIGSNATIIEGVSIGSNSLIGASSLVNKNLERGIVAVGIPCRKI